MAGHVLVPMRDEWSQDTIRPLGNERS